MWNVDKPNIPQFSSLLAFFDGFGANAWCFLLFSFGQCLYKQVFNDFVCDKQGALMSNIVLFESQFETPNQAFSFVIVENK